MNGMNFTGGNDGGGRNVKQQEQINPFSCAHTHTHTPPSQD